VVRPGNKCTVMRGPLPHYHRNGIKQAAHWRWSHYPNPNITGLQKSGFSAAPCVCACLNHLCIAIILPFRFQICKLMSNKSPTKHKFFPSTFRSSPALHLNTL
jgi:hypothetical protein